MSDAALSEWVRLGPNDEVPAEFHVRRNLWQALSWTLYPALIVATSCNRVVVQRKPADPFDLLSLGLIAVIGSGLAYGSAPWWLDLDLSGRRYRFVHRWRRKVREGTFDDFSELLAEDRLEHVRFRLVWQDALRSPAFMILSGESALGKMGAAFGLPVREVAPSLIFRFFNRKVF